MKKNNFFIRALILLLLGTTVLFISCDTDKYEEKKGFVTFGANYHIINCITTVSIFVDGKYIGKLENSTNEIIACGETTNITKEIITGNHTYKIEIRPESNGGCTKDIEGIFTIVENKCEIVFIDYSKIGF